MQVELTFRLNLNPPVVDQILEAQDVDPGDLEEDDGSEVEGIVVEYLKANALDFLSKPGRFREGETKVLVVA